MTKRERLSAPQGLLIDRNKPLAFELEGQRVGGFSGDTIASACYASGEKILSRSFKYHRARGPLTFAG
ncbi:MAG: 2Fe-2S iron-sulfur cluster-binding protein, partial [Pseudomonadota bacterium]